MADWDIVSTSPIGNQSPPLGAQTFGNFWWDEKGNPHTFRTEPHIGISAPKQQSEWSVVGVSPIGGQGGGYDIAPEAIDEARKRPNTEVVYMAPEQYLKLTPPLAEDSRDDSKAKSLRRSLDAGDKIDEIPSLDMTVGPEGGKVIDQDGRHRALFAQDAGVQQIPVAIRRYGGPFKVAQIEGMAGESLPYDFKPVPFMPRTTPPVPQPVKPEPGTQSGGFVKGLLNPVYGAMQAAAHYTPEPLVRGITHIGEAIDRLAGVSSPAPISAEQMDALVERREKDYQEAREKAGEEGFDWAELAGTIASPINYLPMGAATKALAARPVVNALVGGAVSGAMQPVTDTSGGGFGEQKLEQVGLGAAGGLVAGAGGNALARMIWPNVKGAAQRLMAEGVKLTPGMMGGRGAKAVEDKLTSLPIMGDAAAAAQRRALDTFNQATLNRVLAPLGEKMPRGIESGRDAVAYAAERVGRAYDRILPQVQVSMDRALANDLRGLNRLIAYMPPAQINQFARILQDRVFGRFIGRPPGMDGRTLQQVRSELRNFARSYRFSPDPAQRQLADAVASVDLHLGEAIIRQNPRLAPALKAADTAYAMLVRVENASIRRSTSEGKFTPSDLLMAVKQADRTTRHRAFSHGDALMQRFADDAQTVMGNRYPDSGTTGRLLMDAMLTGGATMLGHPEVPIALTLGAAPYSRIGINFLQKYATAFPQLRNMLAQTTRQVAPYAAPGAGAIAGGQVGP